MYQTSLFFKIKDKHRMAEIFFKAWIDTTCNNEVEYTLEEISETTAGSSQREEIHKVYFEKIEDAVVLKLRGVPEEYRNYIELVA